jgi:hypothetical protein
MPQISGVFKGKRLFHQPHALHQLRRGSLAAYPVLVHRLFAPRSLQARLTASAITPLHFANLSPPSGWVRDLHPSAADMLGTHKNPPKQSLDGAPRVFERARDSLASPVRAPLLWFSILGFACLQCLY